MVFFGVRLIPIVSTNIECQCGFYCVYHWDGHRKTNLAVGLVDPMRRVRDSCGIHRNPQGSSTHWSVCPKATLSKCAAEMGRGTTCWYLLIKQTWQNTDDSRPICFFLQGTWSAHGGVLQIHRLISKVRRFSMFSLGMKLGEPLKSSGSWWFSLVDLLFGVVNPSHFQLSFP